MKFNIKKYGLLSAIAATVSFTSCVGDLDVTPIDPSTATPNQFLTNTEAYNQILAKCYIGLAVSSADGSGGAPDIDGIDGGFGQYLRALFNMQELPTDEAVIGWNDQTIKDLHGLQWGASDVFVTAMYSRIIYQISICNEVIRRINESGIQDANLKQYKAEARCLRALSYLHGIDMFGNMSFFTDENPIGYVPTLIKRADLFTWLEKELKEIVDELPANPEKYRCGQGMARMMLAKLYLNAGVYTSQTKYAECAEQCQAIINLGYKLESKDDYFKMFGADNDQFLGVGHEIIFSVYQDHLNTQAYGGSCYIVNAECGGEMDYKALGLGGAGWGGLRLTPEFVDLFGAGDIRGKFFTKGQKKEIEDIGNFQSGYAFIKFDNLKADGSTIDGANSFPDTDIPLYRLADVYLMLAECQVVGGVAVNVGGHDGIWYYNEIRKRAGATESTAPSARAIIDERGRELAWECHRRSDLVRFNLLTTGDYLWAHKGMNSNVGTPHAVNARYNIYPIPANDLMSNTNLDQHDEYKSIN